MRRISHDLTGVAQRMSRLADELMHEVDDTGQVWKDAQAQAFMQQHMREIRPTVQQLVVGITQSVEMFEEIAKKICEPRQ